MASAEDLISQLSVAFASVEENQTQVDTASTGIENTVAQVNQIRAASEELSNQSQALGYSDKVGILAQAITKSNEAQSQFNAAKQTLSGALSELHGASTILREAEQLIHSLKALTGGTPASTAALPPPKPQPKKPVIPPEAAAYRHSPERKEPNARKPDHVPDSYPWDKLHFISWSSLRHVCHGDEDEPEKGGHLNGLKRPGKTEFPPEPPWDDEEFIAEMLTKAAHNPIAVDTRADGTFYAVINYDNVDTVAVVQPDGEITAGWPLEGPRVDQNP